METIKKKKKSAALRSEARWAWFFVAPTMIGLIILNFYPIISTVIESFYRTKGLTGSAFVGFQNYLTAFQDSTTWQALLNTVKYAIIEVPFSVVIALILAVFLNRKMIGRSVYRTIFFLPMVCAPAAVAMVWKWLYNQNFGLINNLFGTNVAWVNDPNITWISIGIIGVWSVLGYNIVLFISGLQEIPGDYYEAASTDLNRKMPGAYALLWQVMKDLKAEGYERFNLWGIAPAGQPNHRYAGVTTFKTGFGGEVVEYVPAHDLVISKVRYMADFAFETLRKKRRHL